ncbi:hypothetical protein HYS94_05000 [Candidatus Daviesbacteria bacterium]|nr:hypothetical protein [Candidatus Daviesbacteria bacterium]
MQKGQSLILIIVGILVVGLIAAGAYYFGKSSAPKPQTQVPVVTQTPQPSQVDGTANWKTYTNNKLGFSLKIPSSWNISLDSSSDVRFSPENFGPTTDNPGGIIPFISVSRVNDPSNKSLVDYLITKRGAEKNFKYEMVTIDGYQGLRTLDLPGQAPYEAVFVIKNTYLYEIVNMYI